MKVIKVTNSNYEKEVINSEIPVLMDFWAEWCGPCKMLAPVIDEIAEQYGDKCKICKINIDDSPGLAGKFKIVSIPTLVIMDKGKVVTTAIGVQPKEQIVSLIESVV